MTLQQLRYAIALADYGSFNEAAKRLFVSQPTLSNAIRDLEEELGVLLFVRTKKGIEILPAGHEFLESARHIVHASDQLLARFKRRQVAPLVRFGVSTLRYGFVSQAFARLVSSLPSSYDVIFHESSCRQALQDVISGKSEVGVLYMDAANSRALTRQIKDNQLVFTPLYTAENSIVVNRLHPLGGRDGVTLADIEPYPFLTYEYEQDDHQSLLEESIFNGRPKKMLRAQDRSTLNWLIRNTNGYSIGHGLMDEEFHQDLIHVPLDFEARYVTVGWLRREERPLSQLAQQFVTLLREEVETRLARKEP